MATLVGEQKKKKAECVEKEFKQCVDVWECALAHSCGCSSANRTREEPEKRCETEPL